jgi:RNA polymerase sigma factor (sigma-70 family)
MEITDERTDSEVIAASLERPDEFGAIFERHFDPIHGYLRRRFADELADELTAQTFFVAFDRRATYSRARPDSRPWLFGIATNLARGHRRRELRELKAIAALRPEHGGGVEGVEGRVDAERMRDRLAHLLAELPGEEAEVLYLLTWAELGQAEIADALGIPLGTVKSRLNRARGRLQSELALPVTPDPDPKTASNASPGGDRWTT